MNVWRRWRRFLAKLTPIIMPSRNKAFVQFVVENVDTDAYIPSRECLSILDVGGSFGLQAHMLASVLQSCKNESLCVVLDIDRNAIARGKKLHRELYYFRGDAHHLPFRSDVFNVVYSFSILDHLQNPSLAINEQVRVCKKTIIVEIPSLNYIIEPHSKVPLLYYYPDKVREKFLKILFIERAYELGLNPSEYINFNAIDKNVIRWFYEAGCKLVKSSKVYHVKWTKIFFMPQGFLMSFKKCGLNKKPENLQVYITCAS